MTSKESTTTPASTAAAVDAFLSTIDSAGRSTEAIAAALAMLSKDISFEQFGALPRDDRDRMYAKMGGNDFFKRLLSSEKSELALLALNVLATFADPASRGAGYDAEMVSLILSILVRFPENENVLNDVYACLSPDLRLSPPLEEAKVKTLATRWGEHRLQWHGKRAEATVLMLIAQSSPPLLALTTLLSMFTSVLTTPPSRGHPEDDDENVVDPTEMIRAAISSSVESALFASNTLIEDEAARAEYLKRALTFSLENVAVTKTTTTKGGRQAETRRRFAFHLASLVLSQPDAVLEEKVLPSFPSGLLTVLSGAVVEIQLELERRASQLPSLPPTLSASSSGMGRSVSSAGSHGGGASISPHPGDGATTTTTTTTRSAVRGVGETLIGTQGDDNGEEGEEGDDRFAEPTLTKGEMNARRRALQNALFITARVAEMAALWAHLGDTEALQTMRCLERALCSICAYHNDTRVRSLRCASPGEEAVWPMLGTEEYEQLSRCAASSLHLFWRDGTELLFAMAAKSRFGECVSVMMRLGSPACHRLLPVLAFFLEEGKVVFPSAFLSAPTRADSAAGPLLPHFTRAFLLGYFREEDLASDQGVAYEMYCFARILFAVIDHVYEPFPGFDDFARCLEAEADALGRLSRAVKGMTATATVANTPEPSLSRRDHELTLRCVQLVFMAVAARCEAVANRSEAKDYRKIHSLDAARGEVEAFAASLPPASPARHAHPRGDGGGADSEEEEEIDEEPDHRALLRLNGAKELAHWRRVCETGGR